jgi:hypothetical protein
MERKYKHRGYMSNGNDREEPARERPSEPRSPRQERMGPKTPRMVGTVLRARCSNCGTVLLPGFDQTGQCRRCQAELHSCKQCVHFDTGARFECTQPIPERISKKNDRNDCKFFEFRMTVEKDTSPVATQAPPVALKTAPRPTDARKAFEDLFKK